MYLDISSIAKKRNLSLFELVIASSFRAMRLARGEASVRPEYKNRKYSVVALHDIQDGFVTVDEIYEELIQKTKSTNEPFVDKNGVVEESDVLAALTLLEAAPNEDLKDGFDFLEPFEPDA